MKKKNKALLLIISLLVVLGLFFLFYFFNKNRSILTTDEKQWIDNNKNEVIDISVVSEIPAFTYNGKGLVFDFLNYVEKETNLTFNPVATTEDNTDSEYSFLLTDKALKKDIKVYQDNYILVSKDQTIYYNLSEIKDRKIGILESDQEKFKNVLDTTNSFITYKTKEELINSNDIDSFIYLKSKFTDYLISNNLNISFQFDLKSDYVFRLNGDEKLNSILEKYFNKWNDEQFDLSFNNNLINDYYAIANINTTKQTDLKKKNYIYGFVENGIYDYIKANTFNGINKIIIKNFSEFADITIKFKEYKNNKSLLNDLNNKKITFAFNNNTNKLNKNIMTTNSNINSEIVAISSISSNYTVNSMLDLQKYNVSVIKDSKAEELLKTNNVKVKTYNNIEELFERANNSVIVIDLKNYDFYKTRNLKNYRINCILNDVHYNYLLYKNENDLFNKLFNFYTNYININQMIDNNYDLVAFKTIDYYLILIIVLILLVILIVLSFIKKVRRLIKNIIKKHKSTFSKEEKMKYIDQLTSLKNRTYLNSKVEKWDESEVYPQSIVVIDLNNISYINDNYGREEGDKIIRDAANILIQNQIPNSEIIRTDGNEFLLYLVGYKEKEIVMYLRKLNRQFKNIDHGFGASIGYSMITDAIKTFDDAVNEATIEMKKNKESTNNK